MSSALKCSVNSNAETPGTNAALFPTFLLPLVREISCCEVRCWRVGGLRACVVKLAKFVEEAGVLVFRVSFRLPDGDEDEEEDVPEPEPDEEEDEEPDVFDEILVDEALVAELDTNTRSGRSVEGAEDPLRINEEPEEDEDVESCFSNREPCLLIEEKEDEGRSKMAVGTDGSVRSWTSCWSSMKRWSSGASLS